MKAGHLLVGTSLLLLGGCNLAPHYSVPTTGTPTSFKEAVASDHSAGEGWKVAQPDDRKERGNWWEIYGDPDLNQLEERVAAANQNVIAAEAAYRQARALESEARAQLFPTVGVDPSLTRSRSSQSVSNINNNNNSSGGSTNGGGSSTGNSTTAHTVFDLPFEASYEVDLWGQVRNSIRQNAALAQASAADYANTLLSLQSTLAQDYFELRAIDEERRILDTTLADYEASLHLTDTLFKSGIVSEEDIAEANTQLDSAQAQATDLGVTRATYEHAIAVLVGVPPAVFSLKDRPFRPKLPAVPVVLPSTLLERRPDVAGNERRVAAANAEIGITRAAFFPTLTLSGSAGFEATQLGSWLDWPNRFWSVGPTLAQTLFDGGQRGAATEHARAAYDQTVAQYRETVLEAFQAVEDNLVTLRILSQETGQQHNATVAAARTVRLSVARYQQGVDSYVNVITAQNTFLTSREAELQVELRQITASINLVKNLGGGWSAADWRENERMAENAPRSLVPGNPPQDTAASIANPPPLEKPVKQPQELLDQDEQEMGVTPSEPARPSGP